MIVRGTLLTVICAVGVVVSLALPGSEGTNAQGARKRKSRVATSRSAAGTPRVSLIDEAGFKQLLARGAPPLDRPLLVNFWATWCDPCREEFPDLVKIDADYRSKGLDFVAISLDDVADMKTTVPRFLRSQHAMMPVYLLNVPDPETIIQMVDTTWQGDMPATFLYDQSGNVVYKHKGPIKPAELRAEIDKLVSIKSVGRN